MNAEGNEAMSAAKLEEEVNPECTRNGLERLQESTTNADAMASAAKLEKEVTDLAGTMETRDKLACLEESAVKAEAMGAAEIEKEVSLPERTVEVRDKLVCLEESAVMAEAMGAAEIEKEDTLPERTVEARDKLARPEESAVKAEAMGAAVLEKEFTLPERTVEKDDHLKDIRDLTALNNEVEALHTNNQILKTNLNKAEKKVTELNNGMQALYSDKEMLKSNLNKAEEEVKMLFNQNRALEEANTRLHSLLERKQKHESGRKHSASTSTTNHDKIDDHTLGYHSAVNIHAFSTEREEPHHDQMSSEGEEPTELDPKDKGLFNFLKVVSNVSCSAINAFNVGFSVLAFSSSGHHATSEIQKLILTVGGICFMPFSIITAGIVHALEGKATDLDFATGCVFAEISYAFLSICLVAMFVAKAPWFVVVPLFFVIWPVTTSWLVARYRRPRGIYRRLRSMKKRFKYKAQRE